MLLTEVSAKVRLVPADAWFKVTFFVPNCFLITFDAFSIVCRTPGVSCLVLLCAWGAALGKGAFRFSAWAIFLGGGACFFMGLPIALPPAVLEGLFASLLGERFRFGDLFVGGI